MIDNESAKTYEELTNRQKRFVDFYIKYWNATKAAKLAGYEHNSAKQIGYENLTKPYLKAIINERAATLVMSEGETAIRLTAFARGSLKPFLDVDGNLFVNSENKKIDLVKKIKTKKRIVRTEESEIETIETEIEIEDRQSALDKLARMMGMYKVDARKEETNPYATYTPEQLLEELNKLGYTITKQDDTQRPPEPQ